MVGAILGLAVGFGWEISLWEDRFWLTLILGVSGGMLVGYVYAWIRLHSEEEVAEKIDQQLGLKDRLITALRLEKREDTASRVAVASCLKALHGENEINWKRLRQVHLPEGVKWIWVPVVLGVLLYMAPPAGGDKRAQYEDERTQARQTGQELAELAKQLEVIAENDSSPQIEEDLNALAEELRRQARDMMRKKEEPVRDAMKKLATLEERVKEMLASSQSGVSMKALEALVQALQTQGQNDLANSLQMALASQDAEALREWMKKLAETEDFEKVMEALEQSAQATPEDPQQREAREMAVREQMERSAQMAQLARQALEKLQEQMQQQESGAQANQGGQRAQGQGGRQMTLEEMLDALEQLKNGMRPGQGGQQGEGASFALSGGQRPQGAEGGEPQMEPGTGNQAGGGQGNENDQTPGGNLMGQTEPAMPQEGEATRLPAIDGGGETASMPMPVAGDTSQAREGIRPVKTSEEIAPEDSIMQENIPLGSRFLIRRYFNQLRGGDGTEF